MDLVDADLFPCRSQSPLTFFTPPSSSQLQFSAEGVSICIFVYLFIYFLVRLFDLWFRTQAIWPPCIGFTVTLVPLKPQSLLTFFTPPSSSQLQFSAEGAPINRFPPQSQLIFFKPPSSSQLQFSADELQRYWQFSHPSGMGG